MCFACLVPHRPMPGERSGRDRRAFTQPVSIATKVTSFYALAGRCAALVAHQRGNALESGQAKIEEGH